MLGVGMALQHLFMNLCVERSQDSRQHRCKPYRLDQQIDCWLDLSANNLIAQPGRVPAEACAEILRSLQPNSKPVTSSMLDCCQFEDAVTTLVAEQALLQLTLAFSSFNQALLQHLRLHLKKCQSSKLVPGLLL